MTWDAADLVRTWGLPTATFVYCVASGLLPFVNAEAFLIVLSSTIMPRSELILLASLAAGGQMIGKSAAYLAGRASLRRPPKKYEAKLAGARTRLEGWRYGVGSFFFLSASTGIPPFYVVSILAGMLKANYVTFLVFGLAGRFLRFGLTLLFPQLIKSLF
jgi:membrane protein YqaA with SNARE-associated domain